ncbi:Na+/H+ antiporter subunit E [Salinifilum ghardaiensis]
MNVLLRRAANVTILTAFYFGQLVRANFELARMVITPRTAETAVIAIPLRTGNPWLLTALANLITLSPGTTTLEVADDRSEIYVHLLTTRPLEQMRTDIMALQSKVLEVAT